MGEPWTEEMCVHCAVNPRRSARAKECHACARYRQRHGIPRPDELIQLDMRRKREQHDAEDL